MDAEIVTKFEALTEKVRTADPKGPSWMRDLTDEPKPKAEAKAKAHTVASIEDTLELAELLADDAEHISHLHESDAAKQDIAGEMKWCPGCRADVLAKRIAARVQYTITPQQRGPRLGVLAHEGFRP